MLSNFTEGPNSEKGIWQFQEAKAKLSEVLNRADKSGRQVIIRNKKHFVILNEEAYNDYIGARRSILDVFLRCPHPDIELDLTRSKETLRDMEL
ncbi:MAG: type II toxin-antitoxin system Phd/YefM family antitoxin [Chlamydiales bacterium]